MGVWNLLIMKSKCPDINSVNFLFNRRICWRPGLLEEENYFLDLFMIITKNYVLSTDDFQRSICNSYIDKLEYLSSFMDVAQYNSTRQMKNWTPIVDCGTSRQQHGAKAKKTTEENGDHIDMQAESKFSRRQCISNVSVSEWNELKAAMYFDGNAVVDVKGDTVQVTDSENFENGSKVNLEAHLAKRQLKYCVCEKSFDLRERLQPPSFIHSEKKHFKCDCCEKSFTRRNNLKSHLLTHSGKKPFKCDFSEKSYTPKHVLKSHLLIHTGEKPFKCDFCENSFL